MTTWLLRGQYNITGVVSQAARASRGAHRKNGLDAAGWHAIMDGLAETTSLTCLNGVEGLGPLFRGGQAEVDLRSKDVGGKEAAVAVSRLLRRSGATMTRLDLRCGSLAASSEYVKKRIE